MEKANARSRGADVAKDTAGAGVRMLGFVQVCASFHLGGWISIPPRFVRSKISLLSICPDCAKLPRVFGSC